MLSTSCSADARCVGQGQFNNENGCSDGMVCGCRRDIRSTRFIHYTSTPDKDIDILHSQPCIAQIKTGFNLCYIKKTDQTSTAIQTTYRVKPEATSKMCTKSPASAAAQNLPSELKRMDRTAAMLPFMSANVSPIFLTSQTRMVVSCNM